MVGLIVYFLHGSQDLIRIGTITKFSGLVLEENALVSSAYHHGTSKKCTISFQVTLCSGLPRRLEGMPTKETYSEGEKSVNTSKLYRGI